MAFEGLFDLDKQTKSFHWPRNELNENQSYVFYKQDNIRPQEDTARLLDSQDRYNEADRM